MIGIHFEPSFRFGDILTLVGFLVVGLGAFYNIKGTLKLFGFRLDVIDATMEDLKKDVGRVKDEVSNGKVQDSKIERLENDVERNSQMIFELQRGRGYVQDSVNGLYSRTGKIKD